VAQMAAVAKLTAAEGKSDELAAVIADLVKAVGAGEPDTLVYAAARDNDDQDVFWFYELYGSTDAQAAHSSGQALVEAGGRMRGLLAGRPEVHHVTAVAAKGLPG